MFFSVLRSDLKVTKIPSIEERQVYKRAVRPAVTYSLWFNRREEAEVKMLRS